MESQKRKTLILGASDNPARYSFLALNRLHDKGHPIVAIGKKETTVAGIPIEKEKKPYTDIHTITLYLNPSNQKQYYDYIVSLHPERIIFNPGTENEELYAIAKKHGIKIQEACTLVLLSTGQY